MPNTIRLIYDGVHAEDVFDASYSPCKWCGHYIWPDHLREHIGGACTNHRSADTVSEDMRLILPLD